MKTYCGTLVNVDQKEQYPRDTAQGPLQRIIHTRMAGVPLDLDRNLARLLHAIYQTSWPPLAARIPAGVRISFFSTNGGTLLPPLAGIEVDTRVELRGCL